MNPLSMKPGKQEDTFPLEGHDFIHSGSKCHAYSEALSMPNRCALQDTEHQEKAMCLEVLLNLHDVKAWKSLK